MAVVAKAPYDFVKKQFTEGKIDLWPFGQQEPTQRNSESMLKITKVVKPIRSENTYEWRKMITKNTLPAVRTEFLEAHKSHRVC